MLRQSGSARKSFGRFTNASAPGIGDVARRIREELIDALAIARYRLADLFLAHCPTTRAPRRATCDGRACRCSRSSSRFLRAGRLQVFSRPMGLSELIAESEEEFEGRAIALAENRLTQRLVDATLYM
jgi:hypothetical protein